MAVRVEYLVRETGTNLWRNISLTIAAVLTVAVCLTMLGVSLLIGYGAEAVNPYLALESVYELEHRGYHFVAQSVQERQSLALEFCALFTKGLLDKLALAKRDAIVLHPGPMNRGVEIDSSVADGHQSVILPQVSFGIAIRMAVMGIVAGN
ncbi:hypothetical protein B4Q13_15165 [Lacticaseibacillus rhamnosus]